MNEHGKKKLSPTVVALGVVSFFTDLSSEMIYPLLPIFLCTVLGAGAVVIGIIEGIAESTASILKLFSGIWADRAKKRKPFIFAGYGLAGLVRPLIGLAGSWPFVLAMRFLDRVGKGVRTSPRDALIADVTDPAARGHAYGFHRAMDHAGAVFGPLLAALLLIVVGLSMRQVFLLAAIPAAIVIVVVIVWVREPVSRSEESKKITVRKSWGELGSNFKRFLAATLVFTLGNSTDAFLLLRLCHTGISAGKVAMLWALLHVVKMVSNYIFGRTSDRLGRRVMIIAGWLIYAAIYVLFALLETPQALVAVFLCYGVYYGLTEPSEKAWVADLVPERLRGTAFGYFNGVIGFAALPASLLFGFLWYMGGHALAFTTGAALALAAAAILMFVRASGAKPAENAG